MAANNRNNDHRFDQGTYVVGSLHPFLSGPLGMAAVTYFGSTNSACSPEVSNSNIRLNTLPIN